MILRNDAFRLLCELSGKPEEALEKQILNNLSLECICSLDMEDAGVDIQTIGESSGYDLDMLTRALFPDNESLQIDREPREILNAVFLWGTGSDESCPSCGCQLEEEHDGTDGISWTNYSCENPNCDFADSGEPDWDVLPGGYALRSEN